jgi:hypothetical protein
MNTDTETLGQMLEQLHRFIRQRPGLEAANYGSAADYRRELRQITKDRRDAEAMLFHVWRCHGMTPELLGNAAKSAFSGRLTWNGTAWEYCTGQYWPTEYRRAACKVLSVALGSYWLPSLPSLDVFRQARNTLGVGVAKRWFR